MKSLNYFIIFLLVFAIIIVIFMTSKKNENNSSNSNNTNVVGLLENGQETDQANAQEMPTKRSLKDLKDLITRSTVLRAVDGFLGTGTANLKTNGTDIYIHSIQAGLPDPESGKFYETWLTGGINDNSFISMGKLAKQGNYYVLYFETDNIYEQLLSYDKIIITLETSSLGLDNHPELHVLEGEF